MTTTLTDALARATKGPASVSIQGQRILLVCPPSDPYFMPWVAEAPNAREAALLAHCRNTLPGLVEAAKTLESYYSNALYDHEKEMWAKLREALRAAQEVKLP